MKCSKCELLYTNWKDGELSTRREKELEDHLAVCDSCRSLFAGLDLIVEASGSLPRFRASDGIAERVMTRIRSSETLAPARFSRWFVPRLAYGGLVMAVVAVVSFAFFRLSDREPSVMAAGAGEKERIYSLGPAVQSTEVVVDEPDYSLGHAPSSEDVIYSLPSLPVAARPASY